MPNSIWVNDNDGPQSIHKVTRTGSQIGQYAREGQAGVGIQSNGCLWIADNAGPDRIRKLTQDVSEVTSFVATGEPYGLDLDSEDSIWFVAEDVDSVYKYDDTGSRLSAFSLSPPTVQGATGLGITSDDCIWIAMQTSTYGYIYEYNTAGSTISSFQTPSDDPHGVSADFEDCIWNVDYNTGSVYQLTQTGSEISSFGGPIGDPAGLGHEPSTFVKALSLSETVTGRKR